jgi:hypothetical protein
VDLNFLYSEHQIALMRASAAETCKGRVGQESIARGIAGRIEQFQRGIGASASQGWGTAS